MCVEIHQDGIGGQRAAIPGWFGRVWIRFRRLGKAENPVVGDCGVFQVRPGRRHMTGDAVVLRASRWRKATTPVLVTVQTAVPVECDLLLWRRSRMRIVT